MTPKAMLDGARLVVTVGAGGVGKTTLAAALGLQGARAGRRVLVLTIDPARRLANSLGLDAFGNTETRIPLDPSVSGELWAMMLDTRTAFDDLISRVASDDATRERILANPIYKVVSDAFASTHEYMAGEKLHDVVHSGRYDLVVLDTPPVKNALDFLEASGRLTRFFDPTVLRWFLAPYDETRVFARLMAGTSAVAWRLLGTIFGRTFLLDLSEFLQLFHGMYGEFERRYAGVTELFRSPDTSFVVVCAPNEPAVDVAAFFAAELGRRGYWLRGVVVNQMHRCLPDPLDAEVEVGALAEAHADGLPPGTAPRVVARLGAAHRRLREVTALEEHQVRRLRRQPGLGGFFVLLPRLEEEVNDLGGLQRLGESLVGGGG